MAITEVQNIQKFINNELSIGTDTHKLLELSATTLKDHNDIISNPSKTYASLSGKISRQLQSLHSSISVLGQLTQLRKTVCCHLASISRFDSKLLHSCVLAFQRSVLNCCHDPDVEFPRGSESEVLSELISYLQWLGLD